MSPPSATRHAPIGRVLVGLSLLAPPLLALPACTDLKRAVGIERSTPDEFTVTTRAPLVMPPDPNAPLPRPEPGAARPQETSDRLGALEAIAPDVALRGDSGAGSPGQSALVADADARAAAPVAKGGEISGGTGLLSSLAFWHKRSGNALVDSGAESRRLADDAANGRSPADGITNARPPG